MPPPNVFHIDQSVMPSLHTRKALLLLDLQVDLVSPDGALPASHTAGYLDRALELATAFRAAGVGTVFWVRSEFEKPRWPDAEPIIASDSLPAPQHQHQQQHHQQHHQQTRGRQRTPTPATGQSDADAEAFLSDCAPAVASPPEANVGGADRRGATRAARGPHQGVKSGNESDGSNSKASSGSGCVRKGTSGAEFTPAVGAAIDTAHDVTIVKTHYSAFASGQLLQLLRMRLATAVYICGAYTNIGVYATALDAARHGLDITLVEDCCGYRTARRHSLAVQQLIQLTGCEVVTAVQVVRSLKQQVAAAAQRSAPRVRPPSTGPPRAALPPPPTLAARGITTTTATTTATTTTTTSSTSQAKGGESGQDFSGSMQKLGIRAEGPTATAAPLQPRVLTTPFQPRTRSAPKAESPIPVDRVDLAVAVNTHSKTTPSTVGESGRPGESPAAAQQENAADATRTSSKDGSQNTKGRPPRPAGSRAEGHSAEDDTSDDLGDLSAAVQQRLSLDENAPPRLEQLSLPSTPILAQFERPSQVSISRTSHSPGVRLKETGSPAKDTKPPSKTSTPGSVTPLAIPISIATEKVKTTGIATASSMTQQDEHTASVSEPLCEGDTAILTNALPPSLAANAFDWLRDEVTWARMSHQGGEVPRLVAVQGQVAPDGSMPVYRHPADESPPLLPFTPTVDTIRTLVERHLGHPLNHVLIQFYRDGNDYISEHSDKTLDIAKGSYIANVSLGAERTMVFRTKRLDKDPSRKQKPALADSSSDDGAEAKIMATATNPLASSSSKMAKSSPDEEDQLKRRVQRARLPHNSLCRMGLQTNMRWLHAIRQDKRLEREKTPEELAFGGGRISLTFRRIGTFLSADSALIWGQGASAKTQDAAHPVVNGQTVEAVRMLQAFGTENHASEFDWDRYYGAGFDVLHMSAAARFFAGPDATANMRVALMLAELGVKCAKGSIGSAGGGSSNNSSAGKKGNIGEDEIPAAADLSLVEDSPIRFIDNDATKSVVQGDAAIMLYLDRVYGQGKDKHKEVSPTQPRLAATLTRFQQALSLLSKWRALQQRQHQHQQRRPVDGQQGAGAANASKRAALKPLRRELALWNGYAEEGAASAATVPGNSRNKTVEDEATDDGKPVYIAGGDIPTVADFALWPVLHEIAEAVGEGELLGGFAALKKYYEGFKRRECVSKAASAGPGA